MVHTLLEEAAFGVWPPPPPYTLLVAGGERDGDHGDGRGGVPGGARGNRSPAFGHPIQTWLWPHAARTASIEHSRC